jgi:hypothetical protein
VQHRSKPPSHGPSIGLRASQDLEDNVCDAVKASYGMMGLNYFHNVKKLIDQSNRGHFFV